MLSLIDDVSPSDGTTRRELVRTLILDGQLSTSSDIATAAELSHQQVIHILERFVAVGALRLSPISPRADVVALEEGSLSARFLDRTIPLW